MKRCCVCQEELRDLSKSYPKFQTDPADPELICVPCLPRALAKTFLTLPKDVREEITEQFTGARETPVIH